MTVLAKKRAAAGMTLEDFAGLLGVSVSTVWRWERGQAFPRKQRILTALTNLLNVAPHDLFV